MKTPQQHADDALAEFQQQRRAIRAERLFTLQTCRLFAPRPANSNQIDPVDAVLAAVRTAMLEAR